MKKLKSWKIGSALAGALLLGAVFTLPARAQTYPSLLEAQSPLDYWRLAETTNSPLVSVVTNLGSAGPAANGYVVSAGYGVTGSNGIVGNGVYISNPGQNVSYCYSRIDIPNLAALNPEPPFTVEYWAKPNSPFDPNDSTGLCPVSSDSPFPGEGSRSGYLFYVVPTSWTFRVGGEEAYTAVATATVTVSTNSFTHVVGEFDGTNAYLYINGVLAATDSAAAGGPFHPNTWAPTRIGGGDLGGNSTGDEYNDANGYPPYGQGTRGWDGWFDEFAVYNTILSSNVIMSHYQAGSTNASPAVYDALILASSPVGYWNFDQPAYTPPSSNSYTFAADIGSLMDDGTNTLGTMANQPGVPGLSAGDRSVYYNGALGSLVTDPTTQYFFAGQPITLAAWIKPTSFGFLSDIIAQGYDETSYAENFLRVGDAFDWESFSDDSSGGNYNPGVVPDVPVYEIGSFDGSASAYASAVYPAPAGDLGHWVFLVGTYDGANWNLYRNGILVNSFSGDLEDGNSGPSDVETPGGTILPWSVGSRSNPNQYFGLFFDGSIEEASILTNALDANTISNLYNSVALPPVITEAPQAPSPAYLGSSATFSVWADGPGPLAYQWYSNATLVVGETATNFSLTGLSAADDGTYSVIVTNSHGAVTSSVVLVVTPTLPPVTVVPAAETRWVGSPLSFAPASLPNQQLFFQWYQNGHSIGGATASSYTAISTPSSGGSYDLVISNSFGVATSTVATLSLLTSTNLYVNTVLSNNPIAYFRLDESSGPTAYDYAGGNNGTYIGDVTLGVPGYSLIDTDTAAYFPGVAETYVGGIGPTAINFSGLAAEFSIEAWANGPANQIVGAAVIAKGHANNGATPNEQFAIIDNGGVYSFFTRDDKGNAATAQANTGPDGTWHHLVGVCDEQGLNGSPGVTLYIDGQVAATGNFSSAFTTDGGVINSQDAVSIGAESSQPSPTYDLAYNGTIDEVGIYSNALTATQVSNHYAAAYGPDLAPFITIQPVSLTNYVTLPASFTVEAAGTVPLSYQWNKVGSGPIAGATTSAFTISNLAYTDAGSYTVGITNTLQGNVVTGILSVPITLTVLAPPTNPPAIAGLVMHLTFDNTLIDATGRGNNATNMVYPTNGVVTTNNYTQGVLGEAFTYQTTTNIGSTNSQYASIGIRPDLQFSSNVNFTVSFWIQEPPNYTGNDLPFFTDAIGSTFGRGYVFAPSFGGSTANWPGSWAYSVFGTVEGEGYYGDLATPGYINDGNFHNLIFVVNRAAPAVVVYLDGVVAHQNVPEGDSSEGLLSLDGDIDTNSPATIGQDPTGAYNQPSDGTFAIDDLGVWRKALTPLEAASIYMAAISNQLSYVGAPVTLSLQKLPGPPLELVLTWNVGDLQSTTNLAGPWTDVPGATSPYTNTPTGASTFFRAKL